MNYRSVPFLTLPPRMPPKVNRVQQLDGLRGVAMLFVFVGHFCALWSQLPHPKGGAEFFLRIVDADATIGSSFFMLLSAFFTYGSLMRGKRSFGEFLSGRMKRIYPLYLLMNGVYIVGCLMLPSMSKLPADPSDAMIFLLQTILFLPGVLRIRPLMDVAWTLSFVVLFYFIACGLANLFGRLGLSRWQRLALLTMAGLVWAFAGQSTGWWEARTASFWTGMALSEAIGAITSARLTGAMRLSIPAAFIAMTGFGLRTWLMLDKPDTGAVPLPVLRFIITAVALTSFVWVAYFGPEWWKRLLAGPQLARLGVTSYSFYLTHGVVIKVFQYGIFRWLGDAMTWNSVFWASQIAGLALAVALARVVYAMIEQPLANFVWFRRTGYTTEESPRVPAAVITADRPEPSAAP